MTSPHRLFRGPGFALVGLAVASILASVCAADDVGADWAQLRGGPGRNGVSSGPAIKPPLRLVWSYRGDADTSGDAGSGVTVGGGKVFANMEMTRSVVALDAETGRFLWEYSHGDVHYQQTSAYADGRCYVWLRHWGRSTLVALDAATGKEEWSRKLNSSKNVLARRSGPTIADGRIFLPDSEPEPTVVALDVRTGDEVWRRPLGAADGEQVTAPCVAGGRVFVGTRVKFERGGEVRGRIVALDAKTGQMLWSNKSIYTMTHMVSDGRLLICKIDREVAMPAADNQKMYVLDATTGTGLWSVPSRSLYATETITADAVIQKHYGGGMVALDKATGKPLWSLSIRTGSGCSSPSVSGDYAYVGTGSFNDSEGFWAWRFIEPPHTQKGQSGLCWALHAIDLRTGQSVWNYLTGCNVCGDPAIAYGRVYFNSRDGRIYCLAPVKEGQASQPDSPDPSPPVPADSVRALLKEPLAEPVAGKDWPMQGGSAERSGLPASLTLPLEPAWTLETGGPVVSAPAVRDGKVFAGSLSGRIFAADLAEGRKLWQFETGGEVRCSPAAADGLVYCGSDDGNFYAIDVATGQPKWKYATGGPVQASPAVVGGAVFFGANDHHLYALNRRTGAKLWSFRTSHPLMQAAPVVRGDQVFAAQWVDWAYALDAATGREQWRTCVPITIESLHFYRDRLWLRSPRQFAEFDPATGKRLRIGDAVYGYNGLAFLGNLMVTTGTGSAATVNLDDAGEDERGKTPNLEGVKVLRAKGMLAYPRLASMGTPLMLGDKMCFASRKGELLVVDPQGKVLWSATLGGTCHSSPVAAAGHVIVGCDDGKLYAFRQAGGK